MLYEIVKAYSDLGIHRTGTDVDHATADWVASHLASRGAKVSRQNFNFDFFEASTRVTLDGREIPSMPLYYEAIGQVKTENVAVAHFVDGEHGGGLDKKLQERIDQATSEGYEALVVATHGETGDLVAMNCEPVIRNRIPVILVPGRYAKALSAKALRVEYIATIEPGDLTNITGHWGEQFMEPPVVITTPMSGWFTCAGERGTGIAVALYVAEYLSRRISHIPLQVVIPGGHELGFYGACRATEAVTTVPRCVLHLGSCIAACDATVQGVIHARPSVRDAIGKALLPMGINPLPPIDHLDSNCWVGESQCWARFGVPMLSLAGTSPLFHTPADTAENATTPELLDNAALSITGAAMALIQDQSRVQRVSQ